MAKRGHPEIRRDPWTKDTHLGFDNRVRVMKTICMDTLTRGRGRSEESLGWNCKKHQHLADEQRNGEERARDVRGRPGECCAQEFKGSSGARTGSDQPGRMFPSGQGK